MAKLCHFFAIDKLKFHVIIANMNSTYILYGLLKKQEDNLKKYFENFYKFFNKSNGDFIINLENKSRNEQILYSCFEQLANKQYVQNAFIALKNNVTEQPYKRSFWHLSDGYLEENDGTYEFNDAANHISIHFMMKLFDLERKNVIADIKDFANCCLKIFQQIYNPDMININCSSINFAEFVVIDKTISLLQSFLIGNSIVEQLEKLYNNQQNNNNNDKKLDDN